MVRLKSEVATSKLSDADEILLTFTKMQALGNDFVVIREEDLNNWLCGNFGHDAPGLSELARKLCHRNFGIGADGLILVSTNSASCDVSWVFLNNDGSSSLMCGNGLRCLSLWCVLNGAVRQQAFTVETGKGPVKVFFKDADHITTDLGEPILQSALIPVSGSSHGKVVAYELALSTRTVTVTCVGMGNPHCLIFEPNFPQTEFAQVAGEIQRHPFFPQGVNVSFVTSYDRASANVVVWERGCGPTLACASAAAAVLVAGVLENRLERQATINLPGGALQIEWRQSDNCIHISGPARVSFVGTVAKTAMEAWQ